jgi:hypothetical protein
VPIVLSIDSCGSPTKLTPWYYIPIFIAGVVLIVSIYLLLRWIRAKFKQAVWRIKDTATDRKISAPDGDRNEVLTNSTAFTSARSLSWPSTNISGLFHRSRGEKNLEAEHIESIELDAAKMV